MLVFHNVFCLKSEKPCFPNDAERHDKLNSYFMVKCVDVQVIKTLVLREKGERQSRFLKRKTKKTHTS